jgi:uncharacterized membrane protein
VLLVVFVAAAVWFLLVLTSPLMVPTDTLTDLSGTTGLRDNDDQFAGLNPVARAVYVLGDIECHQLAERSYFINGNQMPFCSRDVGIFAGVAAGFGLATFFAVNINPVLLMLGLVPMGVDGGVQLVTAYESTNPLRLGTGLLAGASLALIIAAFVFAFRADRPNTEEGPDDRPGQDDA